MRSNAEWANMVRLQMFASAVPRADENVRRASGATAIVFAQLGIRNRGARHSSAFSFVLPIGAPPC